MITFSSGNPIAPRIGGESSRPVPTRIKTDRLSFIANLSGSGRLATAAAIERQAMNDADAQMIGGER